MSIAVIITDRNTDVLCQSLTALLPEVPIQQWPNLPNPDIVKLAVLWQHPKNIINDMSNLQMVVSMGAGMDHIDNDSSIPSHVIRQRIVTLVLKQNMAQYVLQHILQQHRFAHPYQRQQSNRQWQVLESNQPMPTVGFLGLGEIGKFVADQCAALGFKTLAWTNKQEHQSHPCFHGELGLKHVCEHSDYLLVLLPLNKQTENIINRKTLSWCHSNTTLINVGRGGHVNETDLLQALDKGLIKHAILDVFQQEPLPKDHPFWLHPRVILTPHSSSRSDSKQTAQQIAVYYSTL